MKKLLLGLLSILTGVHLIAMEQEFPEQTKAKSEETESERRYIQTADLQKPFTVDKIIFDTLISQSQLMADVTADALNYGIKLGLSESNPLPIPLTKGQFNLLQLYLRHPERSLSSNINTVLAVARIADKLEIPTLFKNILNYIGEMSLEKIDQNLLTPILAIKIKEKILLKNGTIKQIMNFIYTNPSLTSSQLIEKIPQEFFREFMNGDIRLYHFINQINKLDLHNKLALINALKKEIEQDLRPEYMDVLHLRILYNFWGYRNYKYKNLPTYFNEQILLFPSFEYFIVLYIVQNIQKIIIENVLQTTPVPMQAEEETVSVKGLLGYLIMSKELSEVIDLKINELFSFSEKNSRQHPEIKPLVIPLADIFEGIKMKKIISFDLYKYIYDPQRKKYVKQKS